MPKLVQLKPPVTRALPACRLRQRSGQCAPDQCHTQGRQKETAAKDQGLHDEITCTLEEGRQSPNDPIGRYWLLAVGRRASGVSSAPPAGKFEPTNYNHSALIGLRYDALDSGDPRIGRPVTSSPFSNRLHPPCAITERPLPAARASKFGVAIEPPKQPSWRWLFIIAGMAGFGWAADSLGPSASLMGISLILLMTAATAAWFSRYKPQTPLSAVFQAGPLAPEPVHSHS